MRATLLTGLECQMEAMHISSVTSASHWSAAIRAASRLHGSASPYARRPRVVLWSNLRPPRLLSFTRGEACPRSSRTRRTPSHRNIGSRQPRSFMGQRGRVRRSRLRKQRASRRRRRERRRSDGVEIHIVGNRRVLGWTACPRLFYSHARRDVGGLKEHAWKAKRASRTQPHRNALTHTRSGS